MQNLNSYIIEYQLDKLLALLVYSVALWIFCRYWHQETPQKENNCNPIKNIVPASVSTERFRTEQLKTENEELKAKYEEAMKVNKCLCEKNEQLETEIKTVKNCNEALMETLHTVRETGKKLNTKEEFIPAITGKIDECVYDSGTNINELEAMIQVMKGRTVTRNTYGQAVQAIRKTQGTDLYNQLTDRIAGAKQRLEDALNAGYDNGGDDWNNSDIMKYIRV